MRVPDLKYNVGHAGRIGMVTLGVFVLTTPSVIFPSVILVSSPDAYARDGGKGGTGIGGGTIGTDGTESVNGDVNDTLGAFGMDSAGVRASFESLTPQQQARVMQRCQDVVMSPAQANRSQLALCRTLVPLAQR